MQQRQEQQRARENYLWRRPITHPRPLLPHPSIRPSSINHEADRPEISLGAPVSPRQSTYRTREGASISREKGKERGGRGSGAIRRERARKRRQGRREGEGNATMTTRTQLRVNPGTSPSCRATPPIRKSPLRHLPKLHPPPRPSSPHIYILRDRQADAAHIHILGPRGRGQPRSQPGRHYRAYGWKPLLPPRPPPR